MNYKTATKRMKYYVDRYLADALFFTYYNIQKGNYCIHEYFTLISFIYTAPVRDRGDTPKALFSVIPTRHLYTYIYIYIYIPILSC